eukprot:536010_1
MSWQQRQTPCRFYGSAQGCRYGDSCRYSHNDPRSVPLCRNISSYSGCRYGNQCQFRHQNINTTLIHNNNFVHPMNFMHPPIPTFQPPNEYSSATPAINSRRNNITSKSISNITNVNLYPCDAYSIAANHCRNSCGVNTYIKTDNAIFHLISTFACTPDFTFNNTPIQMGVYKNIMKLYTDTDTFAQHAIYFESQLRCPYAKKSTDSTALFGPILNSNIMIKKNVKYCCNFMYIKGKITIGIVSKHFRYEQADVAFNSRMDLRSCNVDDRGIKIEYKDLGTFGINESFQVATFEGDKFIQYKQIVTLKLDMKKKVMSLTNSNNESVDAEFDYIDTSGCYRIAFGLEKAPAHVVVVKQWWESL